MRACLGPNLKNGWKTKETKVAPGPMVTVTSARLMSPIAALFF
jgi:hypothetical protein